MNVNVAIISKSDIDRFEKRLPEGIEIVFYSKKSEGFFEFIESNEKEIDFYIIDHDYPEFPDMISKVKTKAIAFAGNYGQIREQVEPILEKIREEKTPKEERGEEKPPQIIAKERRIVETVIQTKEVVKPATYSLSRKLILVGGLDRGAGSSFIVRNIAAALGNEGMLTALIEPPIGQAYHFSRSLLSPGVLKDMTEEEETRFQSEFAHIPWIISQNQMPGEPYYHQGVQYIISHPDIPVEEWTPEYSRRLVRSAKNAVVSLVDVGVNWEHPAIQELFYEADELFLVQPIEPARVERLFNECYSEYKLFQFLLETRKPITILFNYYRSVVKRDFILDYFDYESIKKEYFIPFVDPDITVKASIDGTAELFDSEELADTIQQIIGKWFPSLTLHQKKKQKFMNQIKGVLDLSTRFLKKDKNIEG